MTEIRWWPTGRPATRIYSFAAQMVTLAGTEALTLYLVRALGAKGFGTFVLAVTISGLALVVADTGLIQSAARYIAESRTDRAACEPCSANPCVSSSR